MLQSPTLLVSSLLEFKERSETSRDSHFVLARLANKGVPSSDYPRRRDKVLLDDTCPDVSNEARDKMGKVRVNTTPTTSTSGTTTSSAAGSFRRRHGRHFDAVETLSQWTEHILEADISQYFSYQQSMGMITKHFPQAKHAHCSQHIADHI